jgi:predicted metal-dependent hydrolase
MKEITVSNIKVDVVRKNIKNIHLAVYPPYGRVRIAVPEKVKEDTIRLYVISKLSWIKRNQKKFKEQDRITPREYKNRESHYFEGKRYLLNIIETDSPPKVIIRNKTYIDLYVRKNTSRDKRNSILNEWYREHLKSKLPKLITKWEKKINVKVNECKVKQMKTKWGSCNISAKRIWLNLELAKKPTICLEYIIVHELIHLIERHHNENFRAYLDRYMNQWQSRKRELNRQPLSHSNWEY